ncbi:hypothetical protein SPWS13_0155 [Shewanella putrefaciens]|nr:hypothetical protein SPWS13_0155 [Shewanella putrefaciens]
MKCLLIKIYQCVDIFSFGDVKNAADISGIFMDTILKWI